MWRATAVSFFSGCRRVDAFTGVWVWVWVCAGDARRYIIGMITRDIKPVSVSVLTDAIRYSLNEVFNTVWVEGEVSGLTTPQSGHVYFNLKDSTAQLNCIVWRTTAGRLPFKIQNGQKLICGGSIDVYPQRGSYQLIIQQVQPVGIGALELAFRQLKEKLQTEGLFDPSAKRSLPRYPKRVAVVTSPTGAAVRDFLQVLTRRWSATDVMIVPVRVQGDGAADEIAAAIDGLQGLADPVDVIVVTRGGGSTEDLWSFNEEKVCRAIFNSRVPVISGVGHEIDITLCDLVADVRTLTPSEAAERLVPDREDFKRQLGNVSQRMRKALESKIENADLRLDRYSSHNALRRPIQAIHRRVQQLDSLADDMHQLIELKMRMHEMQLAAMAEKLELVSPLGVLKRGYSLTTDLTGNVITAAQDVAPGSLIRTRLAVGGITSRVEEVSDA